MKKDEITELFIDIIDALELMDERLQSLREGSGRYISIDWKLDEIKKKVYEIRHSYDDEDDEM